MKRLALYFVGLVCILCNCTAQTVSPSAAKDNSQQNQNKQLQQNVKGQKSTPTYSIISVENTYKLRWTGKAFTGLHRDKANTWLIKAVVKGLDDKWLKHPFSITLIPQHKFLQELQVSEKQSSQNTWICQKFHLSWCCKHNK